MMMVRPLTQEAGQRQVVALDEGLRPDRVRRAMIVGHHIRLHMIHARRR